MTPLALRSAPTRSIRPPAGRPRRLGARRGAGRRCHRLGASLVPMYRSHYASALRPTDAGHEVTLSGWVARIRDHGGLAFIDLRDSSGLAQVTFHDEQVATAESLRVESCVKITGIVR